MDPLPSDVDHVPELELPPPTLQICGFKDGRVTEPAEYHHPWEKADHITDSFEMVRQRWLALRTRRNHTIPCETYAVGQTYGKESRCWWLGPG